MASLNIAAYGEGAMYPPNLANNQSAIAAAGWTTIIFGLFHIDATGDLYFNDTALFKNGSYVGDASWPGQIQNLAQSSNGTITTMLASFGGGGVGDFTNVQNIYDNNNSSFSGTNLQKNFSAMYTTLGAALPTIDMDVEDNYDQASFVALCQMLIGLKFSITFCPYTMMDFWTGSLSALNRSNQGAVLWWNLQCYDGGYGNDPRQWANAISTAIPGFDTTGFIVPGDWVRSKKGGGDAPSDVQNLLSGFSSETAVGGAFLWTLDTMISNTAYTMTDYVKAIQTGLGGDSKTAARR